MNITIIDKADKKEYSIDVSKGGENKQVCPACSHERKKSKDKCFSFFYVNNIDKDKLNYKTSNLNSLGYLVDKKLSDLNKANFDATINSLILKKAPIRNIILNNLSAEAFGAITCHSMFEIITIGHLMEVNPFNQPGVELIKNHSKKQISSL